MIPKLNVKLSNELSKLENYIVNHSCDVEHWFRSQWNHNDVPFYSSIDLRNSGFKLAPVDTNLFPGGFNNLCETFIPLSIQATTVAIEKVCPEARKLIIIPEKHTRNKFYLENLFHLHNILERSGLNVCFGTIDPEIKNPLDLIIDDNKKLKIYPIYKEDKFLKIKFNDGSIFRPCAILLNNDLSGGFPKILEDVEQSIIPSINAGWKIRRKSRHFKFYNSVADEFSEFVDCDPWLINSYFTNQTGINFHEKKGEDELAKNVSLTLEKIKKKYSEYNIKHEPYVVIKADSGTYGMGIMIAKNDDDVKNLNRKKRNRMSIIKDGNEVSEIIIQEGIHSEETINGAVTEPVVYTIDQFVVGGFYRVHTNKEKDENLNSPGMHFIPQPFETSCLMPDQGRPCDDEANRFYAYGVIARLALLAASREIQE